MTTDTITAAPHRRVVSGPGRSTTARTALVVGAATAAAFVLSNAWYIAFAGPYQALLDADVVASSALPAWKVLVELGRSLLVATALAAAAHRLVIATRTQALVLALGVWIAFPVVLLLGSVIHEGVPPQLAAIHAGDWFLKLAVTAIVVRRLGARQALRHSKESAS